jgi:hypothetical protein
VTGGCETAIKFLTWWGPTRSQQGFCSVELRSYFSSLSCMLACLLAEIVGSIPTGGMDVCLLSVVCCQVEVSAMS